MMNAQPTYEHDGSGEAEPALQDQLRRRLEILRHEREKGQAQLETLAIKQAQLRDTMLRISGAIQVLEEMLGAGQSTEETQAGTDDGLRESGGRLTSSSDLAE
jgi:hypothetical protein